MTFQWTRFLELARDLAQQAASADNREAKYRTAISRAYYAAFHQARDYIIATLGRMPQNGNEHLYIQDWFFDAGGRFQKLISDDLEALHRERKHADYHEIRGGIDELERKTREAFILADRIIANLSRLQP